jgi:hypothetical protein
MAADEPVSYVESTPAKHVAPVEQHQTIQTYEQEEEEVEEELEEVEEPAVMASSTPASRQRRHIDEEPENLNSSFWNPPNEPAALQGEEIEVVNTFSPELLSRSLEQQKTENGKMPV